MDDSPVKETMKEDGNEKALRQLNPSAGNNDEVDGEHGDYFPFLALPDELISNTLSFLPVDDRQRVRVNKRLDKIELTSKYYVEKLYIMQDSEEEKEEVLYEYGNSCIFFIEGKKYSTNCIRRLTQNLSVGSLQIWLFGASNFQREVCKLIKDFDIGVLGLAFGNENLENEIMTDSYFLDLTKACKELELDACDNVRPEALYLVYKEMVEGSSKLRKVVFSIQNAESIQFLSLIGITCRDGKYFSNRNIEAIEYTQEFMSESYDRGSFFDGNLEIRFKDEIWVVSFILHESRESLDEARNREGAVKVDINPE